MAARHLISTGFLWIPSRFLVISFELCASGRVPSVELYFDRLQSFYSRSHRTAQESLVSTQLMVEILNQLNISKYNSFSRVAIDPPPQRP